MPPLSIMIKPASGRCNLKCRYCFYSDVKEFRAEKDFEMMSYETACSIIEKALAFADGESIAFAFQGGEPLLRGLDFFRHFTAYVKEKNKNGSRIFYSIQTNGTLVDDGWAEFFRSEKFLVGLSLDGTREANRFRTDAGGKNSYPRILNAAEVLKRNGAEFNILTVLTGYCAEHIDEIYGFFTENGFKYLQFIPCLRPFDGGEGDDGMYMTVRQYEHFLIHCFNAYVKDYVRGNYTSVRFFDNLVRQYLGLPAEQCGVCGHCMHQFVAEGSGNVYPCDFYCTDDCLLGNINNAGTDFDTLAHCDKAISFIKESLAVPDRCRKCVYYPICRAGGCKRLKHDADYCEAYRAFFSQCLPLFRVFIGEKR